MYVCVCTCTHQKWVTTQWGSCRVHSIGNRVVCETEKADVRDKRLPVLLVTPSLFTAFTSLSPPFFPFPCFLPAISCSVFCLCLFLRRGLVSPWPVGTEKQPQWLEDCSSTTTRGRSSSPGSTEMTLGMFHRSKAAVTILDFFFFLGGGDFVSEGPDPVGVDRLGLILKGWQRIMSLFPAKKFIFVYLLCFWKITKPGLHVGQCY